MMLKGTGQSLFCPAPEIELHEKEGAYLFPLLAGESVAIAVFIQYPCDHRQLLGACYPVRHRVAPSSARIVSWKFIGVDKTVIGTM
jgi:hypothetical protein